MGYLPAAMRTLRLLLFAVPIAVTVAPAVAQTVVRIDPRHTYLLRSNDAAPEPLAIALNAVGVSPGQVVRMRAVGDWDCGGPCADNGINTGAVFSNGATLLPATQRFRVPGAIDAGCDVVTGPTYFSSVANDIQEDFAVSLGSTSAVSQAAVIVEVPANATHVFVCALDSLYSDNTDPDGDYGVEFTVLAPTVWQTIQGGVGGTLGEPTLVPDGELACGSRIVLSVGNAPANTPVLLVVGLVRIDLQLLGGVLVPDPLIADVLASTNAAGAADITLLVPVAFPSAASLYFQAWLPDPTAPFLLAATDALRGIAP